MASYKSIMKGVLDKQTGLDNSISEPRGIGPGIHTLTFYVKQNGGGGSVDSQLQVAPNCASPTADWIDFGDPIATAADENVVVNLPAPIGLSAVRLSAGNTTGSIDFSILGIGN